MSSIWLGLCPGARSTRVLAMRGPSEPILKDLQQLVQLLAEQATLETDHGGKVSGARNTLRGGEIVARFLCGLAQKNSRAPAQFQFTVCALNGAPAMVVRENTGSVFATFTLEIAQFDGGTRISAVRVMRNPDKVAALQRTLERGFRLPVRV